MGMNYAEHITSQRQRTPDEESPPTNDTELRSVILPCPARPPARSHHARCRPQSFSVDKEREDFTTNYLFSRVELKSQIYPSLPRTLALSASLPPSLSLHHFTLIINIFASLSPLCHCFPLLLHTFSFFVLLLPLARGPPSPRRLQSELSSRGRPSPSTLCK